jgi:flagellar biosynthetic protein FliR
MALLVPLAAVLAGAWLQRPGPETAPFLAGLQGLGAVELGLRCAGEIGIGLLLGLCAKVALAAASAAGTLIAFQAGLTLVNTLDPNFENQPLLDVLAALLAVMLLLGLDLHHAMLRVLADPFVQVPPGGLPVPGTGWIRLGKELLEAGLKLAAPLLVLLVLVELILGILQKTATEMHLLVVGLPLRFGLSLLALGVCMAYWKATLVRLGHDALFAMQALAHQMAPR